MWESGLGSVLCSVRISGAAWLWSESLTLHLPLRFSRWHDPLCSRGGASIAEEAPPIFISGSAFVVPDPSLKLCSELFLHLQAR